MRNWNKICFMAKKHPENKIITKIAEAPAKALEDAVLSSQQALTRINQPFKRAERYWFAIGPGLTTGAADDDPSGVVTYTQAGARFGFSLLWLAPLSFPLMTVVQEMCARIGMATGRGLAGNIRMLYPAWVLYVLAGILFFTNTFNLGANLGAMAKSAELIFPSVSSVVMLLFFTILSLGLQVFVSYSGYAKFLKYLSLVLLLYIATALTLDFIPWAQVWERAFIPQFDLNRESFIMICAIFGTTISPYLFFWQTSQEVEERRFLGRFNVKLRHQSVRKSEVWQMRFDVLVGMFFSTLVMFFIIITAGAVLFPAGVTIETAEQAALALAPLAGSQASTLFALGIIGTGLLAIPVLAGSAAYALAESFHWKGGFHRGLRHAHAFYGVIIISMGLGLLMNFLGLNPIKMLIYSAVLNGITAPIVLFFIVRIANNKAIMGRWKNNQVVQMIGYIVIVIMTVAAVGAIIAFFWYLDATWLPCNHGQYHKKEQAA